MWDLQAALRARIWNAANGHFSRRPFQETLRCGHRVEQRFDLCPKLSVVAACVVKVFWAPRILDAQSLMKDLLYLLPLCRGHSNYRVNSRNNQAFANFHSRVAVALEISRACAAIAKKWSRFFQTTFL